MKRRNRVKGKLRKKGNANRSVGQSSGINPSNHADIHQSSHHDSPTKPLITPTHQSPPNHPSPISSIDFQLFPIQKILLLDIGCAAAVAVFLLDVGVAAAAAGLTRSSVVKSMAQTLVVENDVLSDFGNGKRAETTQRRRYFESENRRAETVV